MADPAAALSALQDGRIGWPDVPPSAPKNDEGWFLAANQGVLRQLLPRATLVFELGAYLGKSTRFIAAMFRSFTMSSNR